MRSFDLVDFKVAEGEYFLRKILASNDLFEVQFLFSAFVTSIRSVTFCMQACLSDVNGFNQWYEVKQNELKKDILSKFFIEVRNLSQKVGVIPITGGSYGLDGTKFHFGNRNSDFKNIPEEDVATACQKYFRTILKIVYDSYIDFGTTVDPHQYYTKVNFIRMSKTIDDLDEYMMGIRGYTFVPGWPEEYRWDAHRKNTPGCRIEHLFMEYLGLIKPHPPGLPSDPNEYNNEEWIPPCLSDLN